MVMNHDGKLQNMNVYIDQPILCYLDIPKMVNVNGEFYNMNVFLHKPILCYPDFP